MTMASSSKTTRLADEYSMHEWEKAVSPTHPTVECTNCGHKLEDPLPLLFDEATGECFHGCPYCLTDAWLMDLDEEDE